MNSEISLVKCGEYRISSLYPAMKEALGLIGGIEKFVKSGSRVLLKPNLLMAKEPEAGVVTHPEVVRAAVRILKEIGCEIFIGDGPSVWKGEADNLDEVYERSGVKRVAEEEGVRLVEFDKRRWHNGFPLTTWLDACDYLVNLPKFKTHNLTVLTGAVKNLFGLVVGTYKTELHKNFWGVDDFSAMLLDIYRQARPCLTIVDAITAMEGDGPASGGKLRHLGFLLAGSDCVALDSALAVIMGLKPDDIPTNRIAGQWGIAAAGKSEIRVKGLSLEEAAVKDFLLPSAYPYAKLPRPLVNLAKKLLRYYPQIIRKECRRCGACVKACPQKIITMEKNGPRVDYSRCIACFCCAEACAFSAIRVKKSLLTRCVGL